MILLPPARYDLVAAALQRATRAGFGGSNQHREVIEDRTACQSPVVERLPARPAAKVRVVLAARELPIALDARMFLKHCLGLSVSPGSIRLVGAIDAPKRLGRPVVHEASHIVKPFVQPDIR